MDKSHVDILQIAGNYTKLKRTATYNGGQYSGACPICGGTDRFQVWVGKGTVWCRQCGLKGDAIALVQKVDNVDFRTACERLGIRLDDTPQSQRTPQLERKPPTPPHPLETLQPLDRTVPAFTQAWQDNAMRFIEQSHKRLMNDDRAMRYLTETRKLSENVVDFSLLGFNPHPINEQWGDVDVYLPRGIVIPWATLKKADFDNPERIIARIRFRMLDKDYLPTTTRHGKKYPQVAGAMNGLYLDWYWTWDYPDVLQRQTVVLCEGEFDALAVTSHIKARDVRAIATGGTSQARVKEWVDLLSKARKVLLAFDSGETAGPLASVWWSSVLANTKRLKPWEHDINDMVSAGHDLDAWVKGTTPQPRQTSMFNLSDNNPYKHG